MMIIKVSRGKQKELEMVHMGAIDEQGSGECVVDCLKIEWG